MSSFKKTPRTRVRRLAKRGVYDRDSVYRILDEALICHVGFNVDGEPRVLPTAIARVGDAVFLHGNRNSRMLRVLQTGAPACITVTLLDGLVVARSGFHSSMNYRSVVIYGRGSLVVGERKHEVLDAFVDHLIPGRSVDLRPPTRKELNATSVLEFPLEEVSAKVRVGPPADDEEDYELDLWAGVVPLALSPGQPEDDPRLKRGIAPPRYIRAYKR